MVMHQISTNKLKDDRLNRIIAEGDLKSCPDIEIQGGLADNQSKALLYHFLVACKKHLYLTDDELFTISDLYDTVSWTNGLAKVF